MIDAPGVRARQQRGEPDGRLIGLGVATYTEQAAHGTSVFATWGTPVIPGFDQATARITPDGGLEVRVGVHSHGQGMETTFAQIANEILGIPVARIKVLHGDTGQTPYSTGTYASRSLVMSGGAVSQACKRLLPRVLHIAAHLLRTPVEQLAVGDGRFGVRNAGEDRSVSMGEVADAWYLRPHLLPPDVDPLGLEVTVGYKPKVDTGCFTYASQAATVAVDPATGGVEILDYVVVEDCGTMINPMVVEGQTIGGIAQGIGTAFYEETPYDANGQPLASTLADYMLPGPTEVPHMRIHHFETPSPHTEFGAKGMGEGGAIAPPAVLFNAVNDALRAVGAAELAQTPLRLIACCRPSRKASGAATAARPGQREISMKAAKFDYIRPASVEQALDVLRQHAGQAKLMAGGQSLGPMLNLRLARPAAVIDISGLQALRGVTRDGDTVRIGAAVTHAEIEDGVHAALRDSPMRAVAAGIAYRAVRNRGTLGGSLGACRSGGRLGAGHGGAGRAHRAGRPARPAPRRGRCLDAGCLHHRRTGRRADTGRARSGGRWARPVGLLQVPAARPGNSPRPAAPPGSIRPVGRRASRWARWTGRRACFGLAARVARDGAAALDPAAIAREVADAMPDRDEPHRQLHAAALARCLVQATGKGQQP